VSRTYLGDEYASVFIYFVFMFSLFVGGLGWHKYRKAMMRGFHLREYQSTNRKIPSQHGIPER
jgi:hypothetical protein